MAIAGYKLRVNGPGHVDDLVDVGLAYEHEFTDELPGIYYVELASYSDTDPVLQSDWGPPKRITIPGDGVGGGGESLLGGGEALTGGGEALVV